MFLRSDIDSLAEQLVEELDNKCYCGFRQEKKKLEKLKVSLDRRWDEPIDSS